MNREQKSVQTKLKQLLRCRRTRFPSFGGKLEAPDRHGVYIIYSPARKVVHVGNTLRGKRGLYQRLTNHLHGASSFTIKYLNRKPAKLRNNFTYQFIEIDQPRLRALLQAYAIGVLCPAHIGEGVLKKVADKRD